MMQLTHLKITKPRPGAFGLKSALLNNTRLDQIQQQINAVILNAIDRNISGATIPFQRGNNNEGVLCIP